MALVVAGSVLAAGCCKKKSDDGGTAPVAGTASTAALPALASAAPSATAAAPARDDWSDEQAKTALTDYYDTKGEWANRFNLRSVIQMRSDVVTETQRVVHAEYAYEPVLGRRGDKGTDRRTFELSKEGTRWVVKSMGAHESAWFGDEAGGWSDPKALQDVKELYDTRGEWKGRFMLGKVLRYRVDKKSATTRVAYVEYHYEPLPGNPRKGGEDKRAFTFMQSGAGWSVKAMGGHLSAAGALRR
jgi:hypothetical protein